MFQNYTTNDLILYLYNETGMEDSVFIQKAIDTDVEVEEEFRQLVAVKQLLTNTSSTMPSPAAVDSIMAYSQLHGCL